MKYQLTRLKQKNNTELLLDNIVPARTRHIRGYGSGVTLSARGVKWQETPTFATLRMLQYSEPTVVAQ